MGFQEWWTKNWYRKPWSTGALVMEFREVAESAWNACAAELSESVKQAINRALCGSETSPKPCACEDMFHCATVNGQKMYSCKKCGYTGPWRTASAVR